MKPDTTAYAKTQCLYRRRNILIGLVGALASTAIAIMPTNVHSQTLDPPNAEGCLGVISLSRNEARVTENRNEYLKHQESFCLEYHSAKKSDRTAEYGASYKLLSLSLGSDSMSAESLATRFCGDNGTTIERELAYETYLKNVQGDAYEAYKACLDSASDGGLFFRREGAMFLHDEFILGVMFRARTTDEVAKVSFDATKGVNCAWKQGDTVAAGATIDMRDSVQVNIRCHRDNWKMKSGVSIYRINGGARMTLSWHPYDEQYQPVNAMRNMQQSIEELQLDLSDLKENGTVPTGTIAAFLSKECPKHWSPAEGHEDRPNLSGRFLVGVGEYTQDGAMRFDIGQKGGSHQTRVTVQSNQFHCCKGDQGVMGVGAEWREEGGVGVIGEGNTRDWRTSGWMNHFPPYAAVHFCVKD